MAKQALGKGFDILIPKDVDTTILEEDKHRVQKILIEDIVPNAEQPRREFDEQQLSELARVYKTAWCATAHHSYARGRQVPHSGG
jgi:hypothetical protein